MASTKVMVRDKVAAQRGGQLLTLDGAQAHCVSSGGHLVDDLRDLQEVPHALRFGRCGEGSDRGTPGEVGGASRPPTVLLIAICFHNNDKPIQPVLFVTV